MTICYCNGRYVRRQGARVSAEDRGFIFSDGVYEYIALRDGRMMDARGHLDRLDYSLGELRIRPPVQRRVLVMIMQRLARLNHMREGAFYIQVTRGAGKRNHVCDDSKMRPSLLVIPYRLVIHGQSYMQNGATVISHPDTRWARPDIKSVSLLANTLAKTAAAEQGAQEAWLLDDQGFVREGTASNAWIVTDGGLRTHPANGKILQGVTGTVLIHLCRENGIPVSLQPFTIAEAQTADEAFMSAASHIAVPVIKIDVRTIGPGTPGPLTQRLQGLYWDYLQHTTLETQVPWTVGAWGT